jgi:sugar phosphate isomerase/epimerase
MYHDWSRRSLLQLLTAAAGAGKPAVRAGCQTRCYGEAPLPFHLAEREQKTRAEIARETNVRLCVHNHVEETRNDFYELRELLANTPAGDVWLLLDIGHAGIARANAAAFFRSHAARIAGLHVRDRIGERQVPMGTGQVDLRGVVVAIRETGWSGWVIVELEGTSVPGVSSSENVRLARHYLKKEMNI